MKTMRAKLKISSVESKESYENLNFSAVSKLEGYPASGLDEDNSFAKWTPTAKLEMTITNPELIGKFKEGQVFYVDFTEVSAAPSKIE